MIELSAVDRETTIQKIDGVWDAEDPAQVVRDIERTGSLNTAGIGSLMKNPVPGSNSGGNGRIEGFLPRFNVAFRFYGGTQDYPMLMLGLERDESGVAYAVFGETDVFEDGDNPSVTELHEYIDNYDARENPKGNSIYRFPFVDMENTQTGEVRSVIICENDPESDLYVGDALTLDEKAIIIATEYGSQYSLINDKDRAAHQRTNRSYLMETVDAHIKKGDEEGFETDPHLIELMEKVNYYREQMPAGSREFRDMLESGLLASDVSQDEFYAELDGSADNLSDSYNAARQKRRAIDPRALVAADGPELSTQAFIEQLDHARNKLRVTLGMEPLKTDPNRTHLNETMISMESVQDGLKPLAPQLGA